MSDPTDNHPESPLPPVSSELADLVAYLDGELDEVSVESVERRLVEEPSLRTEADRLDRTWQLLDSLSEVTAGSEFTRRTLSSIHSVVVTPTDVHGVTTTETEKSLQSRTTTLSRIWQLTCSFLLSFVLCGAAIVLVEWIRFKDRPADEVQILENLPVLKNFFQINRIPDEDFLKDLEINTPHDSGSDAEPETQP